MSVASCVSSHDSERKKSAPCPRNRSATKATLSDDLPCIPPQSARLLATDTRSKLTVTNERYRYVWEARPTELIHLSSQARLWVGTETADNVLILRYTP